jgi:hypothetical protein
VILLQETLVDEEKARKFMVKFVPNWYIYAVNSVGNSSGLLAAWDPEKLSLVPSLCGGGIILKGFSLENKREMCFLNVYGPCVERKIFWDRVALGGLLDTKNLILARDLNFTIGSDEVWGTIAQLDKHANYFK